MLPPARGPGAPAGRSHPRPARACRERALPVPGAPAARARIPVRARLPWSRAPVRERRPWSCAPVRGHPAVAVLPCGAPIMIM